MKRFLIIIMSFTLLLSLAACSSGSYEDGFSAGYDAGYRAAMDAMGGIQQEPQPTQPPPESTAANPSRQVEPYNGRVFEDIDIDHLAPLEIQTSGDGGYFFVLDPVSLYKSGDSSEFESAYEEWKHRQTQEDRYIRFYVRAGETLEIDVPLGEYEIYYATGEYWYGEELLFGEGTSYFKCDETFIFEEDDSGYTGWTLTLTPVVGGNLDTDEIDIADFP